MPTARERAMCLRLSQDEMDALGEMADELGMPKVSLIRQWIRDAARRRGKSVPMTDGPGISNYFHETFGQKIKRAPGRGERPWRP